MADPSVRYTRFAPPPVARDLVEHLWVARHHAGASTREVLLPDGHGLVVVASGEPGLRIDPLTGLSTPDGSGVSGLATRAVVREQTGPAVRLGAQLDPLALARLSPGSLAVDRREPLGLLLPDVVEATVRAALDAGRDADAARLLGEALGAARRPATEDPTIALLAPALRVAVEERGIITTADLARRADLALGRLDRWFVVHTGVQPTVYLAAVRFSAFVRDAIGRGPAQSQDVLHTIRWYSQANYPPREVERFTGLAPNELRRLERGIADVLGAPA
ncbi:hypothetical protein [Cellulomonas alba]|uniref:HTH araC/xylS-type domain-containing protein n=1 Tax=Cellulomonas alba TaxID=3053467 RepID=A0ABT7SIW0_9CELL|nr:hypothetical protein [Cellulomonas alba]MDM7856123.1 hypothetical protein [Cellulomonas alba]